MPRPLPTVLSALIVLSLVAAIPAASQGGIVAIDASHPLDSEYAISEFERDGAVSANLTRLDMGVAVSKKSKKIGINGWHTDINHRFVCLDYREDIKRTVRIYIPREYVLPRVNAELESITSDTVAKIEPTKDSQYSALTVTFDGPERACFKLSRERGIYFDQKGSLYELVNNSTSFEIPRLAGSEKQWQYIRSSELAGNGSVAVNDSGKTLTMHYDASDDPSTETWLPVPKCQDPSEQPVCKYTKDGEQGVTYVMSTEEEPPRVRYKMGRDVWADVQTWAEDLSQVPGRIKETISGFFGGG